jgi:phenylpyruvate tautomerase PptA (4-oxalocrotonate tautomerase family)
VPRIRVEWLEGRTEVQRQELANRITSAFVEVIGLQPDQVNIVFDEIPREMLYKAAIPWSKRK